MIYNFSFTRQRLRMIFPINHPSFKNNKIKKTHFLKTTFTLLIYLIHFTSASTPQHRHPKHDPAPTPKHILLNKQPQICLYKRINAKRKNPPLLHNTKSSVSTAWSMCGRILKDYPLMKTHSQGWTVGPHYSSFAHGAEASPKTVRTTHFALFYLPRARIDSN